MSMPFEGDHEDDKVLQLAVHFNKDSNLLVDSLAIILKVLVTFDWVLVEEDGASLLLYVDFDQVKAPV
jgi:hypothetical protein